MKRFLAILAVLLLAVLVWFKFQDYRRIHPPEDYEYQTRSDIDTDYHNPELLNKYYKTAYAVGSFARQMWNGHGMDVRFPEADNPQHQNAVNRYNSLKAHADIMGAKLARSKEIKKDGFSNEDIKYMEENGVEPDAYRILQRLGDNTFRFDDEGRGVWEVQARLNSLGHNIPHDGIFKSETEMALKEWQKQNKLYPSGIADWETLYILFK